MEIIFNKNHNSHLHLVTRVIKAFMMSGLLTLISLSFYAHNYSATIHFLQNLYGKRHLFVIWTFSVSFV